MRSRVEIKWFAQCTTMAQVNELYRRLSKKHHPDMGGDLHTMQEINAERDEIVRNPWRIGEVANGNSWKNESGESSKSKSRTWSDFGSCSIPSSGGYTVKVIDVRENEQKGYVALVFDIAEGRHSGFFRSAPWYKHAIYLSYKTDWQLIKTRSIVDKISQSNRGFDGADAFCNNRSAEFIGKKFGVRLSSSYIYGDGFIDAKMVYAI